MKHSTAPYNGSGRRRVRIRDMLIQLGFRLLLAYVQEQEMDKTGRSQAKWHEVRYLCPQRPVSTITSWVKLLHSTGGSCSDPSKCRTTAWVSPPHTHRRNDLSRNCNIFHMSKSENVYCLCSTKQRNLKDVSWL